MQLDVKADEERVMFGLYVRLRTISGDLSNSGLETMQVAGSHNHKQDRKYT